MEILISKTFLREKNVVSFWAFCVFGQKSVKTYLGALAGTNWGDSWGGDVDLWVGKQTKLD